MDSEKFCKVDDELFNNGPCGFHSLDKEGKFVRINDTELAWLECKREDVLYKKGLRDFLSPQSVHVFDEKYFGLLEQGTIRNIEVVLVSKSGREINVLVSANALYNDKKEFIKTSSIVIDITQRKKNEIALRENEEMFRLTFDQSPVGAALVSSEFKFMRVNNSFCDIIGFSESELKNKSFPEITHPEYREQDKQNIQKLIKGDIAQYVTDKRYVCKNGETVWAHVSVRLVRDGNGSLLYFLPIIENITERKHAEDELHKSKNQLRALVDFAVDAILMGNEKGQIIDANICACQLSGYSREEMLGKTITFLFSQDELKRVPFRFDLLDQGLVVRNERIITRKDGSFLVVEMNTKKMPDGTYQAFIRDMTERKKMENALRFSEEKFSKAFKTSPDSININRLSDGNYLDVNEGFTRITGYTYDDVVGRSSLPADLGIWVNKDDRDRLVAVLKKNGFVDSLEALFRKKDGTVLTGLMSARILEINGEVCLLSTTRDITDRKKMEAALSAEKERLRVTLRSIGDGVIATDTDGNVVLLNNVAEDLTGWLAADAYKKPLSKVFHIVNEQTNELCENPVAKVLKTGGVVGLANHTVLISKNEQRYSIADSGAPIRNENGDVIGVVLVFRDVTAKQKTDAALQNTQKLEALGVLAGGIAHDFNNMLVGVFGYIDLARYSKDCGMAAKEYLSHALDVSGRAKALTQQLLTFAKGGSPVKKAVDLRQLLVDTARFALSGSNVKADFNVPDDLWKCESDGNQIGQVIDNLLINARQAMPLGGTIGITAGNVSLQAGTVPQCNDGDYVQFSIQDQGIGIPKEIQMRIFDPFFTTKQQGSGLGLATAYSIVKKHNGHIGVTSEIGKGATFTVLLPVGVPQKGTTPKIEEKKQSACGRILIMDDEVVVRKVGAEMLQSMGCEVFTAEHGDQAIQQYSKCLYDGKPIDILILDLTIPGGKGGFETLTSLKKINPLVKAIASSGYCDDPVMAAPTKYGFVATLSKPYLTKEIQKIVKEVLGKVG